MNNNTKHRKYVSKRLDALRKREKGEAETQEGIVTRRGFRRIARQKVKRIKVGNVLIDVQRQPEPIFDPTGF